MDAMSKNLSIDDARILIYKLINDSDIDTIENFWLIELDNLHLSVNDSNIYNRIIKLKDDNTDASITLYNSCIKGNLVNTLLKKNWRRFFNNNIIKKFNEYKKNCLQQGDKVWVMS